MAIVFLRCSLPGTKMTNTDLARLLKSDEIQAALRAPMYVYSVYFAYEPRHEKSCFSHMQKKGSDQLRGNCAADQHLCFRYVIDSRIPLLSKYEISSL